MHQAIDFLNLQVIEGKCNCDILPSIGCEIGRHSNGGNRALGYPFVAEPAADRMGLVRLKMGSKQDIASARFLRHASDVGLANGLVKEQSGANYIHT